MKSKQELLLDLLGTPDVRFAVPAYQRAYSWGRRQCEELWRDLMRAAHARRSHFIGIVLYAPSAERGAGGGAGEDADAGEGVDVGAGAPNSGDAGGEGADAPVGAPSPFTRLDIVDGQQRLVTATLALLALSEHMRAEQIDFFGMDADFMRASYLAPGGHAKLELSRGDAATLRHLVEGAPAPRKPSRRMLENLAYFRGQMAAPGFDAQELWRGLRSLLVIEAELGPADDAQAIFESFNSKGVPLTCADLVRNYLLVAMSHREQKRLYEQFWLPTQDAFGDDPGSLRLNNAIRAWLTLRCRTARARSDRDAFSVFKVYCEDEYNGSVEALLAELRSFAQVWAENYRYHAVKKYRSYDWASIGRKTLVSDRPLRPPDHPENYAWYTRHYGVNSQL